MVVVREGMELLQTRGVVTSRENGSYRICICFPIYNAPEKFINAKKSTRVIFQHSLEFGRLN